jgi:hypothetical protein
MKTFNQIDFPQVTAAVSHSDANTSEFNSQENIKPNSFT